MSPHLYNLSFFSTFLSSTLQTPLYPVVGRKNKRYSFYLAILAPARKRMLIATIQLSNWASSFLVEGGCRLYPPTHIQILFTERIRDFTTSSQQKEDSCSESNKRGVHFSGSRDTHERGGSWDLRSNDSITANRLEYSISRIEFKCNPCLYPLIVLRIH